MGLSLYDIDERLRVLEEYMVDPETGELLDEEQFFAKYEEIQMALNDKIENTACFIKSLTAEVDAIKAEEKKLADRRKAKENLIARLQNRIDNYIRYSLNDPESPNWFDEINKTKFETPKVKISYRKSDSVNIIDMSKIPIEYIKTKIEETPDKTAIKKAIKDGNEINGAEIITNLSMQIK